MLTRARHRGISLVEAMVVVVVMAFVLAMAAPNFSSWIASSRIRSTAEGMLAGLQYARSEATTRNAQVRFQLTSSLDGSCVRTATAANWVVDVVDADALADSVENRCDATPDGSAPPSILQLRAAAEAGGNVQVNAESSQVVFNGLGRQAPIGLAAAAETVNINMTPTSSGGQCAPAGKVTCLRIVISPAGQVRMCNPNAATGDPQACS